MYKTVRQGENSLQYTILPQTEEVLSNGGMRGRGRDYSPSDQLRIKYRRQTLTYLSLFFLVFVMMASGIFVALIIAGVIPVDTPTRLLPGHSSLITEKVACSTTPAPEKSLSRKKELSSSIVSNSTQNTTVIPTTVTLTAAQDKSSSTTAETIRGTTLQSVSTSYQVPASKEWIASALKRQSSTAPPPSLPTGGSKATTLALDRQSTPLSHLRESNNDLMLRHEPLNSEYDDEDDDEDYGIMKPATTPVARTEKPQLKPTATKETQIQTSTITVVDPTTVSSHNKTSTTKVDDREWNKTNKVNALAFGEMKENILDDDDDDYKEPSTDEEDVSEQTAGDDVKMSQAKSSWLQTRWPFVDPSSYFQWTDYSARDNLLLPAILSAALSALLVLAVLCYALRRRQRCKRRIQEIGNLTSDLQAEDNAVLLTAENPSEED